MPVLMIWRPDDNNSYGHAALQTETYHMSFWPAGNIKDLGKTKAAVSSVPAALILHHQRDKYLEDNRVPIQYVITKVTDEDLDRVFEQFLRFNGIEPDDVVQVKERVNRLIGQKQTEQLLPMIQYGKDVDLPLSKTEYSFLPDLIGQSPSLWSLLFQSEKKSSFAESAQSCTSFCYHLIELADKSRISITPIPVNGYNSFLNSFPGLLLFPGVTGSSKSVLDVPTFEQLAQKHYVQGAAQSSGSVDFTGFRAGNANKNKSKGSK